jgi:hypothetical protein
MRGHSPRLYAENRIPAAYAEIRITSPIERALTETRSSGAAHDFPMPDLAVPTVSVTTAPSISWDQLEVNIHEVRPGSPIWQVHVHELVDDLLDDEPRWSTRMMLFDDAAFAEHWFNAGGLDTGAGATGRLPQEYRESIVDYLENVTGMRTVEPVLADA